eukprot:5096611-Pyramimonas_sp.AAC.1
MKQLMKVTRRRRCQEKWHLFRECPNPAEEPSGDMHGAKRSSNDRRANGCTFAGCFFTAVADESLQGVKNLQTEVVSHDVYLDTETTQGT